jgi:ribosome-binding protein aMBF1 (putative translation factor)
MNNRLLIIMQDTTLRKSFGARVKKLRKQKHWTQKQLAAKVDIRVTEQV